MPSGVKPRGQHKIAAVGQELVIGAVLVHHGNALDPVGRRAGLADIDNLAVEIAGLAGDTLIDRIGNPVRDPPPFVLAGTEPKAPHLRAAEHIPQAEFNGKARIVVNIADPRCRSPGFAR